MEELWRYFWAVVLTHSWAVVLLVAFTWYLTKRTLGIGSEERSRRVGRLEKQADEELRAVDPGLAGEIESGGS